MALKSKIADLNEVAEALRGEYVARDGAFFLDVPGLVDKSKVDEFRTNNNALKEQVEKLTARFDGIDPDEARQLAAEKAKHGTNSNGHGRDVENVVADRVKAARAEWQKNFDGVAAERDRFRQQLERVEIDSVVLKEGTAHKVRGTAVPDLLARAKSVFRLVDGQPRAIEADGKTVRLGRDGVAPLTVAEWIEGQVSEAPHLFEGNAGGGVAGAGSGGAGGRKNPFRRGAEWNVTEQMRLLTNEPATAAEMRAAAGKG